jgi:hypothetical protein
MLVEAGAENSAIGIGLTVIIKGALVTIQPPLLVSVTVMV